MSGLCGLVSCGVLREWCVATTYPRFLTMSVCLLSHPKCHTNTHNGKVETPLFVPSWHLDSGVMRRVHDHTFYWADPSARIHRNKPCCLVWSQILYICCICIITTARHTHCKQQSTIINE